MSLESESSKHELSKKSEVWKNSIFKLKFLRNYRLDFFCWALNRPLLTCRDRFDSKIIYFDTWIKILIFRNFQNLRLIVTYFDIRTHNWPKPQVRIILSSSQPKSVNSLKIICSKNVSIRSLYQKFESSNIAKKVLFILSQPEIQLHRFSVFIVLTPPVKISCSSPKQVQEKRFGNHKFCSVGRKTEYW